VIRSGTCRQTRPGLALIETVLILPLLLLIILGTMEYGWLFWKAADINNAARQGARVGSRGGATAGDITTTVLDVLTASGLQDSGYTVTITPPDPTTLDSGEQLTVQVSVPYANIAVINTAMIPTPDQLSATVIMPREGP
jgi:Flp pilus assembly protein TadG